MCPKKYKLFMNISTFFLIAASGAVVFEVISRIFFN